MEKTIRAILDMDKQARDMEEAVLRQRQEVPQTVEQHRRDLQTAYEHGAAEAVSYTKEEQDKRIVREKAAIDNRQTELLTAMAVQVSRMHDLWVQELTRRVTEQE